MLKLIPLFLTLSACFGGTPSSIDDVDIRDYKILFERCNGNACCESSARNLATSKGYLLRKNEKTCQDGHQMNFLKCVESYKWCEPKK